MGSAGGVAATLAMRFAAGQFLGARDLRIRLPEIELADMRPTVPAHEVAMHTHDEAHLLLLHAGAYRSSARGMPEVCVEPALVLNPPGTRHRDCFESLHGARFLTVSLDAALWSRCGSVLALPSQASRLSSLALPAAYRLWHAIRHDDDVVPLAVEAEVDELLLRAASTDRDDPRMRGAAWLRRARERLHDDAGSVPGVAELARETGMHPVYFARAFRRAFGCPPGDYLRRCRLEQAICAIVGNTRPLSEIALRCGYSDQSHMTRALQDALGLSPLGLRRLSRLQVANLQERRRRRRQAVAIPH